MVLAYIQICHKLWFQQVCNLDGWLIYLFYLINTLFLHSCKDNAYFYWLIPTPSPTDTWKHLNDADQVEVHAGLISKPSPSRACKG